ncbi:MAG: hypothetical protein K6G40_07850 [Eubacterium sp.]|nr:hypothetical protein [Eubacterium sp.]
MKLTDFCLLFVIIFIPAFLYTGLKEYALSEVVFSRQQENFVIDRAVEDGLFSAVTKEDYSGNGEYDWERTVKDIFEEMYFLFDLKTEGERQTFNTYVPVIMALEYDGYRMIEFSGEKIVSGEKKSYPEDEEKFTEVLREELQAAFDEKRPNSGITFSLPYTDNDDWYQNLKTPGMIMIFYGKPVGKGDETYSRIFLSGAGIEKSEDI